MNRVYQNVKCYRCRHEYKEGTSCVVCAPNYNCDQEQCGCSCITSGKYTDPECDCLDEDMIRELEGEDYISEEDHPVLGGVWGNKADSIYDKMW